MLMSHIKRYFIPVLFLVTFVMLPTVAFAANDPATGGVNNPVTVGATSYPVKNPLGSDSFCGLVKNLLQAAIAVGIPIAVLFIVYAGFKFVLARGNPEKLAEARKNFLWTIIGIAIFLGAWLLASVVANTVNALGGSQNIISCN